MDFHTWLEMEEAVEPWQMTREEAIAERTRLLQTHYELCQKHGGHPACNGVPEVEASRKILKSHPLTEMDADFHKHAVSVALAQGKPVPEKVIRSLWWKKGELENIYAHRLAKHRPNFGDLSSGIEDMFN